jgi:hypothetical protein
MMQSMIFYPIDFLHRSFFHHIFSIFKVKLKVHLYEHQQLRQLIRSTTFSNQLQTALQT